MNNNTFISNLNWRYAVKDFDKHKSVNQNDLDLILEAIRLTPTSFGLQPYHIHVVSNVDIKKELKRASYNQNQISDCQYLLVFCARTDIQKLTTEYIKTASKSLPLLEKAKLKAFEAMVRGYFAGKSQDFTLNWSKNQTYLALGFALAAAAELKVDTSPMEGFNKNKYDQILNNPDNVKSTVLLAIGTRAKDPKRPKVRFSKEEVFTITD